MGEIIVKVPFYKKKIFTNIDEAIEKLIELKKIKEQDNALDFILNNSGRLPKDYEISEEELHMQED